MAGQRANERGLEGWRAKIEVSRAGGYEGAREVGAIRVRGRVRERERRRVR